MELENLIEELEDILYEFGESIDPHGVGDGSFNEAIGAIIRLLSKK